MILICTADEALGRRVAAGARGRRAYARTVDEALSFARWRPSAILLDVRLGGNGTRAVEVIPRLMQASPLSAIVVLTRSPTGLELEEIEALGVYMWIDMASLDLTAAVRLVLEGASERGAASGAAFLRRRRSVH